MLIPSCEVYISNLVDVSIVEHLCFSLSQKGKPRTNTSNEKTFSQFDPSQHFIHAVCALKGPLRRFDVVKISCLWNGVINENYSWNLVVCTG